MKNTPQPTARICCECGQPITGSFERYSPMNPRDDRLICSPCVRALLRRTIEALARVPEAARDTLEFEL